MHLSIRRDGEVLVMIKIKRVYDHPSKDDGKRILIDRLWPRGLKKEDAQIDEWIKDIAPSNQLRKWFNHDPKKWDEFKSRFFTELRGNRGNGGGNHQCGSEGHCDIAVRIKGRTFQQCRSIEGIY